MSRRMTDHERLAEDLELLGMVADPSKGPLAHLYAGPSAENEAARAPQRFTGATWHRGLERILIAAGWLRDVRPKFSRRYLDRTPAPTP
jgi:hypothetical protein